MAQLGTYFRKMSGGYGHWCPGCEGMHYIAVEKPLSNGAKWAFNGDIEKPTFSPSVNIKVPGSVAEEIVPEQCHYFITDGQIRFCGDCTHGLSGQTVPLPPCADKV